MGVVCVHGGLHGGGGAMGSRRTACSRQHAYRSNNAAKHRPNLTCASISLAGWHASRIRSISSDASYSTSLPSSSACSASWSESLNGSVPPPDAGVSASRALRALPASPPSTARIAPMLLEWWFGWEANTSCCVRARSSGPATTAADSWVWAVWLVFRIA